MSADLPPEEQYVREETLRKLHADPERYLADYTREFGNVLNADSAATLFDEYNADRARYREASTPPPPGKGQFIWWPSRITLKVGSDFMRTFKANTDPAESPKKRTLVSEATREANRRFARLEAQQAVEGLRKLHAEKAARKKPRQAA